MSEPFFRPEALEAQQSDSDGTVNIATPLSYMAWAIASVSLIIILGLGSYFCTYQRREHATGMLMPDAGLITVKAPSSGYVAQLTARESDAVAPDKPLLMLSGELDSASLGGTQSMVSKELHDQLDHLDAQARQTSAMNVVQVGELRNKERLLQQDLGHISEQQRIARQELKNSNNILERYQQLSAQQYASLLQIQQQKQQSLELEMKLKSLEREEVSTRSQLTDIEQSLKSAPLTTQQRLDSIETQKTQSRQQLAENELKRQTLIKPSTTGTIASLLVHNNQYVSAGEPLYTLRPAGSKLEAQLFLPSTAIGFIHSGQKVVLHTRAFPYQKYGSQHGVVSQVSATALKPTEVTALLGAQPPNEALYRVFVTLDDMSVDTEQGSRSLSAGMMVDADILLEKRRLYEWVFEPLFGISRR